MAWTDSRIFRAFLQYEMLKDTAGSVTLAGYSTLVADTIKAALFNNSVTPDRDAALTSTGYNTGTWLTANEQTSGNWTAAGVALSSKAFSNPSTGVMMYDAADVAPGGTSTLTNVFGTLVYDDSITTGTNGVADQGVCFNYFGGAQSVTSGTFTIVWNANGLFRFTV